MKLRDEIENKVKLRYQKNILTFFLKIKNGKLKQI